MSASGVRVEVRRGGHRVMGLNLSRDVFRELVALMTDDDVTALVVQCGEHCVMELNLSRDVFHELMALLMGDGVTALDIDLAPNASRALQTKLGFLRTQQLLCVPVRELGLSPDLWQWCNFRGRVFLHQLLSPRSWWEHQGDRGPAFANRVERWLIELNWRRGTDLALGYNLQPFQPLP